VPPEFPYPLRPLSITISVSDKMNGSAASHRPDPRPHEMERTMRQTKSITERFFEKVDKTPGLGPNGDCWDWVGAKTDKGYGNFILFDNGPWMVATRFSYAFHGYKIPVGMFMCHTCDNRACVNPAHLFPGTQQDNIDDMHRKGRHTQYERSGERNPKAKLTKDQVLYIRACNKSGESSPSISKRMGISYSTVREIIRRDTWRHI
jgi:hypothetical protein